MKTFSNVASLKLAKLKEGQFVETGGYYTKGDGGGSRYLIVTPQAADEYGDHTLANGNVAVLQKSDVVSVEQYGALPSQADNQPQLQAIIDAAGANPVVLSFCVEGVYLSGKLVISDDQDVTFDGNKVATLKKIDALNDLLIEIVTGKHPQRRN